MRTRGQTLWYSRYICTLWISKDRTGNTGLVKSREMTGRTQKKHCRGGWGGGGEGVNTTENKNIGPVALNQPTTFQRNNIFPRTSYTFMSKGPLFYLYDPIIDWENDDL